MQRNIQYRRVLGIFLISSSEGIYFWNTTVHVRKEEDEWHRSWLYSRICTSRVIFWDFAEDDSERYKSIYFTSELWLRHKPARCAHPSFLAYFTPPLERCALSAHRNFIGKSNPRIKTSSLGWNKPGFPTVIILRTGYSTENIYQGSCIYVH